MPPAPRPLPALFAACLLACPAAAQAGAPCGPHVAALYPFARFYFEGPQTRPGGIDQDMFDELARRSGCRLTLVVQSRARIWEQMRRGSVQLTLSALPSPERLRLAELVPYAQGRYQVLMRRELAARVASLADFEADPRLRLLDVRGYAHGPTLDAWVQRMRGQGRLVETGDFKTAERMLRAGRADGLLTLPDGWGAVTAAGDGPGGFVALDVAPQERNAISLALARAMPEADRLRLRRALQAMLADGTVYGILRRHLGDPAARAALLPPGCGGGRAGADNPAPCP
ncbi:MAG: transporter substrate-binding domain-containing protein [Roseateles sp.]|uniref:substrate-binding periplasmic protein n=1 Tax=Roseateles sp. TaxID=1971397 RepID=UPI0039E92401